MNYYNEFDPVAAQHLRNLIAAGHIAPGVVDSRSIEDVKPNDLAPFTQCHFFAGIGAWSLALRQAGWPDERPVWTGSCPCQPFSAAGEGAGFDDPRHLWPSWHWLVKQRRPGVIFGEQVASKDANPWVDLVQTDVEAMGYTFGALAFPSAGVGAPHIRDRAYWVAHADHAGSQRRGERGHGGRECAIGPSGLAGRMGDSKSARAGADEQPRQLHGVEQTSTSSGWVADPVRSGWGEECADSRGLRIRDSTQGQSAGFGASGSDLRPGPANGFWRAADWLACTDGKWRPVEPGTQPLADGAPARVGRLCAYGNAINVEAASHFVECAMEHPAIGGPL